MFTAVAALAAAVVVDLVRTLIGFARDRASSPRLLCVIARSLAATPALWIATFALLVARAWVEAGEMPSAPTGPCVFQGGYPSPNIRASGFSLHAHVVLFGLFAVPLTSALALVAWSERRAWREEAERSRLVDAAACVAGLVLILAADPGGFWAWFVHD